MITKSKKLKPMKVDWKGKDLYVGIDVHKKSWDVCVCTDQLNMRSVHMNDPTAKGLVSYLDRNYPNGTYHCAYEAGFSGFWLQRELSARGIDAIVVNAADIPTSDRDKRFKSDKLDCRKIARALKANQLRSLYILDRKAEKIRSLDRLRDRLSRDERRIKCRIQSHLLLNNIKQPQYYPWCKRFVSALRNVAKQHNDYVLKLHLNQLDSQHKEVLSAKRELKLMMDQEGLTANVELLESIPGVGFLSSMTWLTEIAEISRFKSDDEYLSFIGIVPGSRSSGEKQGQGELTYRGNKRIRTALVIAAWNAIRISPSMALYYEQYCKRMIGQKAIIRVAKKLALIMKAVIKNQSPYDPALSRA